MEAAFNGVSYRGSTMPVGDGTCCLGVTKAVRAQAGLEIGDVVEVVVARDEVERVVDVPTELVSALAAAGLRARFDVMAFTHREEYARWVGEAKQPETRAARAVRAVTMIRTGARPSGAVVGSGP